MLQAIHILRIWVEPRHNGACGNVLEDGFSDLTQIDPVTLRAIQEPGGGGVSS
jgi:hypothetical protein